MQGYGVGFFISVTDAAMCTAMCTDLLCALHHNIIALKTFFACRLSGFQINKASQSFSNAHILQTRLGESTNVCKVMNIVFNNIQPIL